MLIRKSGRGLLSSFHETVATWEIEGEGKSHFEYRRRAKTEDGLWHDFIGREDVCPPKNPFFSDLPEIRWYRYPRWASGVLQHLPVEICEAIDLKSQAMVDASGWVSVFRAIPRHVLDSCIPLKCLYRQLRSHNLKNAFNLLHQDDPVFGAICIEDVPLLKELRDAGEIFIRDELSLITAISTKSFKSACFLLENDVAKWLLTPDQKTELLKALKEHDHPTARCIVVHAYEVRKLYNTALETHEEFRQKLTAAEESRDDIKLLLVNMNPLPFKDALETVQELRTQFQQQIEGVLAVLLVYMTKRKMDPPTLGEDDLFFTDIDRWRSRVEESKLGLFDDVVRLAWGKKGYREDCPKVDFEEEYKRMDSDLRELLRNGFEDTVLEPDDVTAPQNEDLVQTRDPESEPSIQSIQQSDSGPSREILRKAAIILMAGVTCAAVLLCTLGMNDLSRAALQLTLCSTYWGVLQ